MHLWVHMDVIRDIRFSVAFLETNERASVSVCIGTFTRLIVGWLLAVLVASW